jgi:two-component system sporulation sensor kinase A
VNELLDQVTSLTHKRCSDQGVECFWKPEPDLPPLALVPDRIQQVFLNLVLNALDAMPDGGHLQVTATRTEEPLGVRISFRDGGMGISEDSLPHVFEPFYSTKRDGLGLGLFISQDIVQQHGGRMDVRSTVGEGTEFNIWLPA